MTDASIEGAGVVLSQGKSGKDHLIVYTSHSFNKAGRNYIMVKKELATIVWGIKYFIPYLYDRNSNL
jgi:hypothetical protein